MREGGFPGVETNMSKGEGSGDVEQVGGQDRCGWTLTCLLNKYTLRVHPMLTPCEVLEYRGSKQHRQTPRVGPEDSERLYRVGGWGGKGKEKSARQTRVGRTFQAEGTASDRSL